MPAQDPRSEQVEPQVRERMLGEEGETSWGEKERERERVCVCVCARARVCVSCSVVSVSLQSHEL